MVELILRLPIFISLLLLSSIYLVESRCSQGCGLAFGSYYVSLGTSMDFIAEVTNTGFFDILKYNPLIASQNHLLNDIRIDVPFSCDCINGDFLGHVFRYNVRSGDTYDLIAEKYYANLTTAASIQRFEFDHYDPNRIPESGVLNVTVNCSCGDSGISRDYRVFVTYPLRPSDSLNSIALQTRINPILLESYYPDVDFSAGTGIIYIPYTDPVPPGFTQDSASKPSNFTPGSENDEERTRLIVGLSVGGVCALVGGLAVVLCAFQRKRKREKEDDDRFNKEMDNEFRTGMGPKRFSIHELARATNNFSEEGKLGEGGFGGVYKGFLKELSSYVAVKRVSKSSKQGIKEYASEVRIISRLRHKNMVQLIGWCHEKRELLLVYEFMENGSLDSHLFKQKSLLNWEIRYKIAQGLASALLYLHEDWEQCVLHRDIKSSNVMLDSNFNAKLGDFGLAKLVDHEKGSQTTVLAGTMGYMAPECYVTGKATKETDVFSFGVVALEISCGRKPIDFKAEPNQIRLVEWVWELYGTGNLLEAADSRLQFNFAEQEMEHLMIVGLWCAHPDEKERPPIKKAIQVLNFEAPLPTLPPTMPVPTYSAPPTSLLSSAYGKEFSANSEIQLSCGR